MHEPHVAPSFNRARFYEAAAHSLTVADVLSDFYYLPNERVGQFRYGVVVKQNEIDARKILSCDELVEKLVSFGLKRQISEERLVAYDFRAVYKYGLLIRDFGIDSPAAHSYLGSHGNDDAFLACAEAVEFAVKEQRRRQGAVGST